MLKVNSFAEVIIAVTTIETFLRALRRGHYSFTGTNALADSYVILRYTVVASRPRPGSTVNQTSSRIYTRSDACVQVQLQATCVHVPSATWESSVHAYIIM